MGIGRVFKNIQDGHKKENCQDPVNAEKEEERNVEHLKDAREIADEREKQSIRVVIDIVLHSSM